MRKMNYLVNVFHVLKSVEWGRPLRVFFYTLISLGLITLLLTIFAVINKVFAELGW